VCLSGAPSELGGAGAPEVEITAPMVEAAIRAMRPYFWEDGQIGVTDLRTAVEAALRAGLQVRTAAVPLAPISAD
jgi:hypothetical protein